MDSARCPRCHGVLGPDPATGGLCPRCLLLLGLGDGGGAADETRLAAPPVPEQCERVRPPADQPRRILALLGRGPHGLVYLAEQDRPPRLVAIKVFDRTVTGQEAAPLLALLDRLITLRHPAIIPAVDAGITADGHPFLVSEFRRGVPLDRFSRRARPEPGRMLSCLAEVADAVRHLQDAGLAHGHLVAENVRMPAGEVESPGVCDAGCSAVAGQPPHPGADSAALVALVRQFAAPLPPAAASLLDQAEALRPSEIAALLRGLARSLQSPA
jgi:hypothetical protein